MNLNDCYAHTCAWFLDNSENPCAQRFSLDEQNYLNGNKRRIIEDHCLLSVLSKLIIIESFRTENKNEDEYEFCLRLSCTVCFRPVFARRSRNFLTLARLKQFSLAFFTLCCCCCCCLTSSRKIIVVSGLHTRQRRTLNYF